MALQLWETLKEAIVAYTGLSPATFFTLLALLVAIYHVISGLFGSSDNHQAPRSMEEMQPLAPPVQLGEITEDDLKQYDGTDPKNPLLMAIKGQIYDVSQSRMFYGPGGPYALFAGKDASRALAKMSFEDKDLTGDISGLGPFELDALQDWEYKFMSKYVKVGTIKKAETDGEAAGETTKPIRAPSELVDENEKLRKENMQLTKELAEVKSLCNNIFSMVSNYACAQSESGFPDVKPLDLMPGKRFSGDGKKEEEEASPKLFGVAIGAKRARVTVGDGVEEDETGLRLQQPSGGGDVKSEPLDVDRQETPWLNQRHMANQRVCN